MISTLAQEINAGDDSQTMNHHLSSSLVYTSGEIRNSMSSILNLISAIYTQNSGNQSGLSEIGHELLGQVRKSSSYALNLVDDLDAFVESQSDGICLETSWINLVDLLTEVYQMVDVTRTNPSVDLLLDIAEFLPSNFYCDPLRLRQILVNLLNNALKFTQSGYVRLGAFVDGNRMMIFVDDTGPGIPEAYSAMVFEPFQQVKGHRERGFGLGLALCRKFARLHGGEIYLQSELGVGSCFIVVLPIL